MLMDGTHHLDPEIPASAVIPVNPRVELVEGDIHGANAVLHKQLTRLPLYFSIRVRARVDDNIAKPASPPLENNIFLSMNIPDKNMFLH